MSDEPTKRILCHPSDQARFEEHGYRGELLPVTPTRYATPGKAFVLDEAKIREQLEAIDPLDLVLDWRPPARTGRLW